MNGDYAFPDLSAVAEHFTEKEFFRNASFLVTGATGLIGSVLVKSLLYLNDSFGMNTRVAAHVRDREKAKEYINGLPDEWKSIDVLVNNAGLALGLEPEYEGNLDDWETMIDTNIKGLLTMTRLVVPGMVERNSGHVINVGSVAGDAAYAGGNVYCATKAAVKALTDGLRIDVANTALRVTNLKPGLVETNFSNIRFKGDEERAAKLYTGIKPLTGDDIADVAVYAANAPAHVQIAEVLILATHQASGSVIVRK